MAKKPAKIHHLFLINLTFCVVKPVWQQTVVYGYSKAELSFLSSKATCTSCVLHGICEQKVQSLPMYPLEPSLQLVNGLLPAKVGSCLQSDASC